MAAARLKTPAAVKRWLNKLKPAQMAELEQQLAERRRLLALPRRPMDEVLAEIAVEQAATLAELHELDLADS